MKRQVMLFLVLSCSFCAEVLASDNPIAAFEERRAAVAELMESATVWIVTEDSDSISVGSGFIVAEGFIVTNAHVVADMEKGGTIYVTNEKIPVRKARITAIGYDSAREGSNVGGKDFALLRFESPKGVELPVPSLTFNVKRMDRVSAWGYPAMATQFDIRTRRLKRGDTSGLEAPPVVYTEGTVNAVVRSKPGEAILHSAWIAGGNSGGPLVNGRGEVVGMNTWGYTEEDEGAFLNLAQTSAELAAFLKKNGVVPRLAPGQYLAELPVEKEPVEKEPEEPSQFRMPGKFGKEENGRRNLGGFSVLVPGGWSVIDEEDNMILLGSNDRKASVGIMIRENHEKTLREVTQDLMGRFGGENLEQDDGIYSFNFWDDDVETFIIVGEGNYDGEFVVIILTGDTGRSGVEDILNSVEDAP